MISIDQLAYRSGLRKVSAVEKTAYALMTLVICVAGRSLEAALMAFAANGFLVIRKGKVSLPRYGKMLLMPLVFLILGTGAVIVNISEIPLDAFAIRLGGWYLTGSRAGIWKGLELGTVAMSAVSSMYFLAVSTPVTDVLGVLRKIRVPSLFLELMLLIYRFIFVLLGTAEGIMTAQKCRMGNRDLRTGIRSFGMMGSALFIRSVKRAGALYDSMEARCYDGEIRVLSRERPVRKKEVLMIGAWEILLVFVTLWSIMR